MLNIINIQFGQNRNNYKKPKIIYNNGDIITDRPKTSKYPYKIVTTKEFLYNFLNEKKYIRKANNNINLNKYNNIYTIKKSNSLGREYFKNLNEKKKILSSFEEISDLIKVNHYPLSASKTNKNAFLKKNENDNKNKLKLSKHKFNFLSHSMNKHLEQYINKKKGYNMRKFFNKLNSNEKNIKQSDSFSNSYDSNFNLKDLLDIKKTSKDTYANRYYTPKKLICRKSSKKRDDFKIYTKYSNYYSNMKYFYENAYNSNLDQEILDGIKRKIDFAKKNDEDDKSRNNHKISKSEFIEEIKLKTNNSCKNQKIKLYNYRKNLSGKSLKNLNKKKEDNKKNNNNLKKSHIFLTTKKNDSNTNNKDILEKTKTIRYIGDIKKKNSLGEKIKYKNKYIEKYKYNKDIKLKRKQSKISNNKITNVFYGFNSSKKFLYMNRTNDNHKNEDIFHYIFPEKIDEIKKDNHIDNITEQV